MRDDWEAEQTVARNIDRLSTAEELLQAVTDMGAEPNGAQGEPATQLRKFCHETKVIAPSSSDGCFTQSAKQVENTCADQNPADKSVEYPPETFAGSLRQFGRTIKRLNQIVDNSMRRHEAAHEQYMQDVIGNCNGDG